MRRTSRSAFQYSGPVVESGYPRNDLFFTANDEATIERIRTQLQLPEGKKVILYAPTFRDHQSLGKGSSTSTIRLISTGSRKR